MRGNTSFLRQRWLSPPNRRSTDKPHKGRGSKDRKGSGGAGEKIGRGKETTGTEVQKRAEQIEQDRRSRIEQEEKDRKVRELKRERESRAAQSCDQLAGNPNDLHRVGGGVPYETLGANAS
jgi:hypothetical protein